PHTPWRAVKEAEASAPSPAWSPGRRGLSLGRGAPPFFARWSLHVDARSTPALESGDHASVYRHPPRCRSAVLLDELEVLNRNGDQVQGFAGGAHDLDHLGLAVVHDDGALGAGGPGAGAFELGDGLGEGDDIDFADCLLDGCHDSSSLG